MFRSDNSLDMCSDQRTFQVYVQIGEQFSYMFRSENSSDKCPDHKAVQVYEKIGEQFRKNGSFSEN